jgi:hypothetical protein
MYLVAELHGAGGGMGTSLRERCQRRAEGGGRSCRLGGGIGQRGAGTLHGRFFLRVCHAYLECGGRRGGAACAACYREARQPDRGSREIDR